MLLLKVREDEGAVFGKTLVCSLSSSESNISRGSAAVPAAAEEVKWGDFLAADGVVDACETISSGELVVSGYRHQYMSVRKLLECKALDRSTYGRVVPDFLSGMAFGI